ncbi:MAG: hypothetical protein COV79_05605 [Parcubacteria group bacterium CG11_big_fil_rev_8_21_14_0_20_41_14]|nr:MAG: hypothetical protein COV79_05605 [Parcubacteria group bacterium CG11_big_fil_rev_8_21_14_0_20_41_14]
MPIENSVPLVSSLSFLINFSACSKVLPNKFGAISSIFKEYIASNSSIDFQNVPRSLINSHLATNPFVNNTEFKEPSGLNPENVSTAYDIAKLLSLAGKNETIREIAGMHRSMIQVYPSNIRRTVLTTNHLLGTIVFVSFGKTGYLDEAMYNLATSVSLPNGNEVYIVTLGSQTNEERVQDAKNLAVWAQRTYQWNN